MRQGYRTSALWAFADDGRQDPQYNCIHQGRPSGGIRISVGFGVVIAKFEQPRWQYLYSPKSRRVAMVEVSLMLVPFYSHSKQQVSKGKGNHGNRQSRSS